MELERFLGEIPDLSPGGIDLDETGELVQLDLLSRWSDPEHEPDWLALREAAAAALDRSRDLRAAVYLASALLHTDGIIAFCEALCMLQRLCESMWDELYPRLDGDDAIERSSALYNLTNFHKVVRPLRTRPLVEDRLAGRFSLFDIEIAKGKVELPAEYPGDPPQQALVDAAFQNMDLPWLQQLESATAKADAALEAIEALFRIQAGASTAPDLKRIRSPLAQINAIAGEQLGARADVGANADTVEQQTPANQPSKPSAGSGSIHSRQDAIKAIDSVSLYFKTYEPSSPVPLLLERAKRLVNMNFLEILGDIAPDALMQVKAISGEQGGEST